MSTVWTGYRAVGAKQSTFQLLQLITRVPALIRWSFEQLQALGQPRRQLLGRALRRRCSRSGGGGGVRRGLRGCSCSATAWLLNALLRCITGLDARLLHQEARTHSELALGATRGHFNAFQRIVNGQRAECIAGMGAAAAQQARLALPPPAAAGQALMRGAGIQRLDRGWAIASCSWIAPCACEKRRAAAMVRSRRLCARRLYSRVFAFYSTAVGGRAAAAALPSGRPIPCLLLAGS